jgi:hypothetical protein
MIARKFDPEALTEPADVQWWKDWSGKAVAATAEIINKWETNGKLTTTDFDSEVWGELKQWLLKKVFFGKCAYCETPLRAARQPGDAEHFRPKGGIRFKSGAEAKTTTVQYPDGRKDKHPGYYWLAYHWWNVLPACTFCNSNNGKKNQFPVRNDFVFLARMPSAAAGGPARVRESTKFRGFHYPEPSELDELEGPQLLHPYRDDPAQHLVFGTRGIIAPRLDSNGQPSPKGLASIETFHLNDDALRSQRQREQELQYQRFNTARSSGVLEGLSKAECERRGWHAITGVMNGTEPYSAAVRDFICLHHDIPAGM